ncbi:S1 RNA-binding domain-containing protein 1 [Phlebotomus argentipes]|uniref:S1 RNA-binding domain-containing protein 1 n=1 Tax=Phlebotomus argentipes TaxID=94469 RepID=UPI00289331BF|nr:S1 RNA-binding domain-containing protein 1 [Phlebotomus argentipes]
MQNTHEIMSFEFNYVPKKRKPVEEIAETSRKRVKTKKETTEEAPKEAIRSAAKKKLVRNPFATVRRPAAADNAELQAVWTIPELLAEFENISPTVAENIVQLFEQDNTIPFICRYRRHLVDNLEPDKLREIKSSIYKINQLRTRVTLMGKTLEKEKLLTSDLRETISKVKTMEELNHIYEYYKPARKKSLVEKATNLGLLPVANMLLSGDTLVNFANYVDPSESALSSVAEVKAGVAILISSIIMKNAKLLDFIREKRKTSKIELQSSQAKAKASDGQNSADPTKYELYFNFKTLVSHIRPHQVLAINRGEKNKILSVKINIPSEMQISLVRFIFGLYRGQLEYRERTEYLQKIINDMYTKKIVPLVTKEVRQELNDMAEKASIEVFANNLRQLLLMCPVKGERILGIDPGFSHGCKLAMISEQGTVLETAVIYPHTKKDVSTDAVSILHQMLTRHKCRIVALGNGTACRETESLLMDVKMRTRLDLTYCITSEQGASVYSCSEIAKKEFPDLDVNLISAVSIARRLNNPLAEFVKVEPKHLGVGMYQHDVNEKLLAESLQEIMMECVSFVGVDINTASELLLQSVAGLTPARAKNIIEYRQKNGSFGSREELKKVKLIGEKTFTQCAGFVRVETKTAGKVVDPLDGTWVHPESYHIARAIIKIVSLETKDIGRFHFIQKVKVFSEDTETIRRLAEGMSSSVECIMTVCEALQRMPSQDYRDDLNKRPHFKKGLTKISDLKPETIATGSITNVTHFGCFVDLGVEKNGLIHTKNLRGLKPGIGDSVEVTIVSVDETQGRIQLRLEKIL